MKKNRIIALSAFIALAFSVGVPAQAQIGGILKNAKKNVEQKVKKKVESTADDAVDKATEAGKKKAEEKVEEKTGISSSKSSSNSRGSSLETLYKQNYKPSAEALAADPDASNDEVWRRSTRSFAQIHAAYEHLDPKYFPLQPYYKYPMMYGLGNDVLIGYNVNLDMIRKVLSKRPGASVDFSLSFMTRKRTPSSLLPRARRWVSTAMMLSAIPLRQLSLQIPIATLPWINLLYY